MGLGDSDFTIGDLYITPRGGYPHKALRKINIETFLSFCNHVSRGIERTHLLEGRRTLVAISLLIILVQVHLCLTAKLIT